MPFTSDPSTHRQCFNVTIIEDGTLEDVEIFSLNLTLVGGSTVPVVVDPDTSIVEIIDRDRKHFCEDSTVKFHVYSHYTCFNM